METIGRLVVGALCTTAFGLAQALLVHVVGEHWTRMVYEALAFLAFCCMLQRVIFTSKHKTAEEPDYD